MWFLFEMLKYLRSFMYDVFTQTFAISSECIGSSMHRYLHICMGVEILVVLFECLESSMHMRLYIRVGLRHLSFCSSV